MVFIPAESWSLKKWVFGFCEWTKHNIDFKEPQGIYFLGKHDELSESVAFGQKLRYFTDQNEPKLGLHKGKFLTIFKFRNEFYNQTEQKK